MSFRTSAITLVAAISLVGAMRALAFDNASWIEVSGGDWHPDQEVLTRVESAFQHALIHPANGREPVRPWKDYEFQYQGRTSLLGRQFVEVNAFCDHSDLGKKFLQSKWVKVYDGGSCYFSGKFDPNSNRAYYIQFNGSA